MYVGDEEGWRHPATIRVAEGGLQFPLPTSSFIWKNKSSSCSRGGGVSSQGRTFFMANDFSPQLSPYPPRHRPLLPQGCYWWVPIPHQGISPFKLSHHRMVLGKLKSAEGSAAPCSCHHKQLRDLQVGKSWGDWKSNDLFYGLNQGRTTSEPTAVQLT